MSTHPYVVAIVSHKGGTGRTTTVLALACAWAQSGTRVTLIDADPIRSTRLIALDGTGQCHWPGITHKIGLDAISDEPDSEIVVIDSPSLLDPLSRPVLGRVDGVILTCLADPLSLRTIPAAANAIEVARTTNPGLEFLGILVTAFNERDDVQKAMCGRLRQAHAELVLEPPIPLAGEIRNWALQPGTPVPEGKAYDAYRAVAKNLVLCMRKEHAA